MPPYRLRVAATNGLCIVLAPLNAHADVVHDSKASLELRNAYINRDYHQANAPQSLAEEWAQGFVLRLESGYTEGPIGVGVDALGKLGLKLDSSPDRRGTGLLPYGDSQEPVDDYSNLGLTAKLRLSKTVLKVGTLQPLLPVVSYNDGRLLPSTYSGALLTSQDIEHLTLNVGRLEEENLRDSSSNDPISYAGIESDHLDLAGGTYAINPQLAATYYVAQMADLYRQHFVGLVHELPLGEGVSLRSDLRYFDTREQGDKALRSPTRVDGGTIDNRFFNGMLTLAVGAQKFAVGYQNLSGDGDFPFPGRDPYSINLVTASVFNKAETDAWQLRYDYNFAAMGIPGLTFMTRYVNGTHVNTATVKDGREWERDTDLVYTVQSGPLKNVNLRLRNASFRSSNGLTSDFDESRVIIGYSVALW